MATPLLPRLISSRPVRTILVTTGALTLLRGPAALAIRFGVPVALGALVFSPVFSGLPLWAFLLARLVLLLPGLWYVLFLLLDERARATDRLALNAHRTRGATLDGRILALEGEVTRSQCQLALLTEKQAEASRKEREQRQIAQQNAEGYEKLSAVVINHIAELCGEDAVRRVKTDLERLERAEALRTDHLGGDLDHN